MSFANKLTISCDICDWERIFYTFKQCARSNKNQGRDMFKINVRAIVAFREIGRGLEVIKSFSRCMIINSVSDPTYRNIMNNFVKHMKRASDEVAFSSPKQQSDIPLAPAKIDGAWQNCGHSSANGVVTVTVGNKYVDIHVHSKHRKQCQVWEIQQGTPKYSNWKDSHVCSVNHTANSGAMEAAGAIDMFRRSIEKNNLIHHDEYLGDGDTSSFKAVADSKSYKEYSITPTKLECIGHVQKRLGTGLRNKVNTYEGTSTPIGGRGQLHEKTINTMQNIYGIAMYVCMRCMYEMYV